MKVSILWLKEILGIKNNISDDEIITAIEQLGYEIENVDKKNVELLRNIKVVKVVSVKKHPNAEHLTICEITDGEKITEVVCGAPNVYTGMITAYISAGNILPNGTKIESKKIRGVVSYGMLCSAKELCLYDDHTGILELDNSFKIGNTLDKYFNDVIIEITTPANRYDCLGHYCIAKEVAAKFKIDFKKFYDYDSLILKFKNLPYFNVKILSTDLCKRYIAIQIVNVNNKIQLPFFITYRLNSLGIRSINPLVDISNYVMLEVGHSVHIFDYEKLSGGKIFVRNAKDKEKIVALDNKEYELDDTMIVIADEEKPVAVAGIIGGLNSCVDQNTTQLVIESAVFNRSMIRLTRKKLGINTEASFRFERGSGWNLCEIAALRTCELILSHCGGEVVKLSDERDIEYYNKLSSFDKNAIRTNLDFISSLLGIEIDTRQFIDILHRLGYNIKFSIENLSTERVFLVQPPLERNDVEFQADIAEEIARYIGYEKIPETLPANIMQFSEKLSYEKIEKKCIQTLISTGLTQVINYSLCSSQDNNVVINAENFKISVFNPVSNEYTDLRLSLFPSLLKNLLHNYNNQIENIGLFEIGKIFYKKDNRAVEEQCIGIILHGQQEVLPWQHKSIEYDIYYLCGIVELLLNTLEIKFKKTLQISQDYTRPVLTKELMLDNMYYVEDTTSELLATACKINKQKLKVKLPKEIFYAEIYLNVLEKFITDIKKYVPLPKYPYVIRDLCLVVKENVYYPQVEEIIKQLVNSKGLDVEIKLIDYYEKGDFPSLTLNIKLRDKNKTLTDDETNNIMSEIINELNKHGLFLRQK